MHSGQVRRRELKISCLLYQVTSVPQQERGVGTREESLPNVKEVVTMETQVLLHLYGVLFCFFPLPGKRNNKLSKFKFPLTPKS